MRPFFFFFLLLFFCSILSFYLFSHLRLFFFSLSQYISIHLFVNKFHQYPYFSTHWCASNRSINWNRKISMHVAFDLSDNCLTAAHKITNTQTTQWYGNIFEADKRLGSFYLPFTRPRRLIKCPAFGGTRSGNNLSYRIRIDQLKWDDIMCAHKHYPTCINFMGFDWASYISSVGYGRLNILYFSKTRKWIR